DPSTGEYTFDDVNNDGVLNLEDRIITQDFSRKFFGGFQNNIQYRNWGISLLFEFVKQKSINPMLAYGAPGSQSNFPIEYIDRWQDPENIGKYQGVTQARDLLFDRFSSSDAAVVD